MSALDKWRGEVRALLPRGFLRRARGEGLFVSDYPRYADNVENVMTALRDAGFHAACRNGLLVLDGNAQKYAALARDAVLRERPACGGQSAYLYFLALRLSAAPVPPERQPVPLLRLTLKMLDAGDEAGLERELPPLLAACQRQKTPLPAAAGHLILRYIAEKEGCLC